ncbi:MAG: chorismate synthase [Eggerthellaceae bacterium]|nr:chorismate synthase [Eggerthellaceae bacterium]
MRYFTAGESHGPQLTAIVNGVPAGLPVNLSNLDSDMARRQSGYGRGDRQKIESDRAEVTSGVRFGVTTGAPISITVQNRDWENWEVRMGHFSDKPEGMQREVTPRPGHADLVGALRTNTDDCRNILERASARETAARVAACGIAKEFLAALGVEVMSYVTSIGRIRMEDQGQVVYEPVEVEFSPVRCPDPTASELMCREIDSAKEAGESLGGTFRVIATGLIPGLGSYATGPERLTSLLGGAMFSIPAIKGVQFGMGFEAARNVGSKVHDGIELADGAFTRASNNAGGLEGGMTTGMPLVIEAAMKPIPTLMNPLDTVNMDTLEPEEASRERSDVCAVPAAAVVAEGEVAMVLADAYTKAFGETCMADIKANIAHYQERLSTMAR